MADNQQQNGSQQFENATDGQQQHALNGTAENASNTTANSDSGQFECVRDDDRSVGKKKKKKNLSTQPRSVSNAYVRVHGSAFARSISRSRLALSPRPRASARFPSRFPRSSANIRLGSAKYG